MDIARVLKSANADDVIDCSEQTTPFSISNLSFSGRVTLKGGIIDVPAGAKGVQISQVSNLSLEGFSFRGPGASGVGAYLRNCSNVGIVNCSFDGLMDGVFHQRNDGMMLEGNRFTRIGEDGIRGLESCGVAIRRNFFTDFARAGALHPDCIQWWTTNATRRSSDFLIEENVMLRGEGTAAQGIFLGNEWKMPHQGVVIRRNVIIGMMSNGIAIGYGQDVTIEDNIVVGYSDMASKIRVENSDQVACSGNRTSHWVLAGNSGFVADPTPVTYQLPLFKGGLVDPPTPEALVRGLGLGDVAGLSPEPEGASKLAEALERLAGVQREEAEAEAQIVDLQGRLDGMTSSFKAAQKGQAEIQAALDAANHKIAAGLTALS